MKHSAALVEFAGTAEEISAGMALKFASTKDELVSIWWRDCDAFTGDARARLQDIYADRLREFAPMQAAG